jgi:hypothetical protein
VQDNIAAQSRGFDIWSCPFEGQVGDVEDDIDRGLVLGRWQGKATHALGVVVKVWFPIVV